MKKITMLIVLFLSWSLVVSAEPPTRSEIEKMMGIPSQGDQVRGQLDTVGYVVTPGQANDLLKAVLPAEKISQEQNTGIIGGICPHDDHLYSAAITAQFTRQITARRVILIGVFHKARLWDLEGTLVFDSFEAWRGPWGPVAVDAELRGEILEKMPQESVVVSNTMHCREHSLEGIVPFLQFENSEVEIVPILVPYLNWSQLQALSDQLAEALGATIKAHDWKLGRDLAIVISSDAVHYGPDFDHAPFGVGIEAYKQGVERDNALIARYLEGPIQSARLRELYATLVNPDDPRQYRLPWCGRFSIPFGLEVLAKLGGEIDGHLLQYGTSISEPEPVLLPETRSQGLGYTAASNLHHWVGFFSLAVTE